MKRDHFSILKAIALSKFNQQDDGDRTTTTKVVIALTSVECTIINADNGKTLLLRPSSLGARLNPYMLELDRNSEYFEILNLRS
jgi:hypothetical protein